MAIYIKDTIYFKRFSESLGEDEYQYSLCSINQQKDWYITWLEGELGNCYNKI